MKAKKQKKKSGDGISLSSSIHPEPNGLNDVFTCSSDSLETIEIECPDIEYTELLVKAHPPYDETSGYKYKITENELVLEASRLIDKGWILKKCEALKLKSYDDGQIVIKKGKRIIKLDVSLVEELYILIHLYHRNFKGTSPVTICKIKEI